MAFQPNDRVADLTISIQPLSAVVANRNCHTLNIVFFASPTQITVTKRQIKGHTKLGCLCFYHQSMSQTLEQPNGYFFGGRLSQKDEEDEGRGFMTADG
eukprot:4057721-Amphidinium_carterae.2